MKNLIAELLVKLAQKEEESKELVAQVEALEIVVTALLRQMAKTDQQALIESVEGALDSVRPDSALSSLPRRMPTAAQPVHWSLKSYSPRTVPNRSRLLE